MRLVNGKPVIATHAWVRRTQKTWSCMHCATIKAAIGFAGYSSIFEYTDSAGVKSRRAPSCRRSTETAA